jgi:hypothetical protein
VYGMMNAMHTTHAMKTELNTNVKPFVPSKQLLEKIEKENMKKDEKKKMEKVEVDFDKLESIWWERNKVWLSME